MRSIGLAVLMLFFACQASAADNYTKVCQDGHVRWTKIPLPLGVSYSNIPDLKSLEWHRRTVGNIEILALDDSQGIYLKQSLPQIVPWLTSRWGLRPAQMTAPVRMLVVNDAELMKKLFKIQHSKAEPFRNYEGQTLHVVYLLFNGQPLDSIADPMTTLALAEQSRLGGGNFGFWAQRGMANLNGSLNKVRANMAALTGPSRSNQLIPSGKLFTLTQDEWYKLKPEEKAKYDSQCAALCLLLRKEFGQQNLHTFWRGGGTEGAFAQVYGFSGFAEFDRSYFRYCFDIANEVSINRAPDHYLQINAVVQR
tara:strand:+ start:4760 stop:5686 length:927 start_codon:yes stop_codon:yes gene_type:complete